MYACNVFYLYFFVAFVPLCVFGKTRTYFIGSLEELWDYAPSGKSMILNQSDADVHPGGHVYRKAIFHEFTDVTFSEKVVKSPRLGFLGPLIKAETGDTIVVHYKNMVPFQTTIHPHDVHYTKENEGSIYRSDETAVEQNETRTYSWTVKQGPADHAPDCVTSLYHSAVDITRDVNSGLIGMLLICKPGTLSKPTIDSMNHILFPTVIDESKSWFSSNTKEFTGGHKMTSVNGYSFGNGPAIEACLRDELTLHFSAIDCSYGAHTIRIHGHTLLVNGRRKESVTIIPGGSVSAKLLVSEVGSWMITSQGFQQYQDGMHVLLRVKGCGRERMRIQSTGKVRRYYIAIEEVEWNYAPTGRNLFRNISLIQNGSESSKYFTDEDGFNGGIYKKAVYKEYTSASFKFLKSRSSDEIHLGFLGPVLRAEVGDIIKVVLLNKATRPYSIHPQGVRYNKANEGAHYNDSSDLACKTKLCESIVHKDDMVLPWKQKTYFWNVPDYLAPADRDADCIVRIYTSAVNYVRDVASGLVGPLLICKKDKLTVDGRKLSDGTKEFFLLFSTTDENRSWYVDSNRNSYAGNMTQAVIRSNLRNNINGYMYSNLPHPEVCLRHKVMWYMMSVGRADDIHTVHFHGHIFTVDGRKQDAHALIPGSTAELQMSTRKAGTWAITDVAPGHVEAGGSALFTVESCLEGLPQFRRSSHIPLYLAVEEVYWNYKTGEGSTNSTCGRFCYKRAVFRRYSDELFSRSVDRPQSGIYLGNIGPIISTETGITFEITFRNKATLPYTLFARGVEVEKADEGAVYGDVTALVAPGQERRYTWVIPHDLQPGQDDSACSILPFYSGAYLDRDPYTGPLGILNVCRQRTLDFLSERQDFTRQMFYTIGAVDETRSRYWEQNRRRLEEQFDITDRKDSSLYSVNGFLTGHIPESRFIIGQDSHVELNFLGIDNNVHTLHIHGSQNTSFPVSDINRDITTVFPWTTSIVRLEPEVGTWLIEGLTSCDVKENLTIIYHVINPRSGA